MSRSRGDDRGPFWAPPTGPRKTVQMPPVGVFDSRCRRTLERACDRAHEAGDRHLADHIGGILNGAVPLPGVAS